MLPEAHRLHRSSEFRAVVRSGARRGRRTVVVYALPAGRIPGETSPAGVGGPRFGLVVSKAVGNAVTRHRVSRRLRHVLGEIVRAGELDESLRVVVRALPPVVEAGPEELARDVAGALDGALRRGAEQWAKA